MKRFCMPRQIPNNLRWLARILRYGALVGTILVIVGGLLLVCFMPLKVWPIILGAVLLLIGCLLLRGLKT